MTYPVTRRYLIVAIAVTLAATVHAQRGAGAGGGRQGGPPPTPRAGALTDLTGYWVSLVTEDWRYRQFTPPKGDYTSVPINPAGRKIADAWDPAKDEAAGEQCKAYGAAGLMRMPTRVHITWQDDATLKLETDAGTLFIVDHAVDRILPAASDATLGFKTRGIAIIDS